MFWRVILTSSNKNSNPLPCGGFLDTLSGFYHVNSLCFLLCDSVSISCAFLSYLKVNRLKYQQVVSELGCEGREIKICLLTTRST